MLKFKLERNIDGGAYLKKIEAPTLEELTTPTERIPETHSLEDLKAEYERT